MKRSNMIPIWTVTTFRARDVTVDGCVAVVLLSDFTLGLHLNTVHFYTGITQETLSVSQCNTDI